MVNLDLNAAAKRLSLNVQGPPASKWSTSGSRQIVPMRPGEGAIPGNFMNKALRWTAPSDGIAMCQITVQILNR
jgi:hypothetical protein